MKKLLKFTLIFSTFLLLLLSIITLLLFIVSIIMGSYCEFQKELLSQTDFTAIFTEFKLAAGTDTKMISFMNECVAQGGKGNLLGILGVPSISNFDTLLGGFKEFDQISSQITSYTQSVAIQESIKIYDKLKDGQLPTH